MGEEPANQPLLDHLALQFMETGWSVKRVIRDLVLSRAYQLSGNHDAMNYRVDPENRLCWQMTHRRLDAEAIRDAILHASGELDLKPFDGSVVHGLGDLDFGQNNKDFAARSGAVATHRSVYLPIIRNSVPEALRVFDFAEPSLIVGRRDVTTVPTQALFMLNDPFVLAQSERMARRVIDGAADDEHRLALASTTTLGRPATTREREQALALLNDLRENLDAPNEADRNRLAWATLCQSLIGTAEFRYLD
jgi:hypothetical protein